MFFPNSWFCAHSPQKVNVSMLTQFMLSVLQDLPLLTNTVVLWLFVDVAFVMHYTAV